MADNNLDDQPRIPILTKPVSLMQSGGGADGLLNANRLSSVVVSKHPVAQLQLMSERNPYHDLNHVRHVYGSALAMRLATERRIAHQEAMWKCSLHQSGTSISYGGGGSLYGEVCSGQDVQLRWEDVLGLPGDRPDLDCANPHAALERQLRLSS